MADVFLEVIKTLASEPDTLITLTRDEWVNVVSSPYWAKAAEHTHVCLTHESVYLYTDSAYWYMRQIAEEIFSDGWKRFTLPEYMLFVNMYSRLTTKTFEDVFVVKHDMVDVNYVKVQIKTYTEVFVA